MLGNAITLTVTGGTGRFTGASGTIQGQGTLDLRVPRPLSNLALSGTLDLPALPEPESWALMLGGFALSGTVLRRRFRSARGRNHIPITLR